MRQAVVPDSRYGKQFLQKATPLPWRQRAELERAVEDFWRLAKAGKTPSVIRQERNLLSVQIDDVILTMRQVYAGIEFVDFEIVFRVPPVEIDGSAVIVPFDTAQGRHSQAYVPVVQNLYRSASAVSKAADCWRKWTLSLQTVALRPTVVIFQLGTRLKKGF